MIRSEAMTALLEDLTHLGGGAADQYESQISRFLPLSAHRLALRPDCIIVRGARGVGKTALFGVLRELATSARIRQFFGDDRLPDGQWIDGFMERSLSHPHTSVIDDFARTSAEPALRGFWIAHLLRRLHDCFPDQVVLPQFLASPPGDDLKASQTWIAEAEQHLGAMGMALDRTERALAEQGQMLFVAYDQLDRLGTFEPAVRRRCVAALLALWLSLSQRYRHLRAKIFLRDDLYNVVAAVFPDSSKLRSVAIEWEESSLYRVAVRHMANLSLALRTFVEAVPGLRLRKPDAAIGWLPEEMDIEVQRAFVAQLAGPTMGKGPRKMHTHRWILNRLQDANGRVVPRSLLSLMGCAAEHALGESTTVPKARLLRPQDLEAGLDSTSRQRLAELTEEYPILRRAENLAGLTLPLPRGQVEKELAKPVTGEDSRLPDDGGLILAELAGLGVLHIGREGQVDVADLYRSGYGIHRGAEPQAFPPPQPTGWIYYEQGQALFELASRTDGSEARQYYDRAIQLYRNALRSTPEFSAAAYQLGRTLRKLARLDAARAREYRQEARQVLGSLLQRDHDNEQAMFQFELTHAEEADALPATEVTPILQRIIDRRQPALTNLRAWSLGELASMKPMPEANALFQQAVQLIESAPRRNPHTFELWGRLLCKWAQRKGAADAMAFMDQVGERALRALQLEPNFSKALNLWGIVPKAKAARSNREEAQVLLKLSLDRFQLAYLNRRRDVRNLLDWSETFVELALNAKGLEGRGFLESAEAKVHEALTINPESSEAWSGQGWLAFVEAEFFAQDNASALRLRAEEAYQKAAVISPMAGSYSAGLGHVRLAQGNEAEAAACFQRAEEYRPGAGAYGLARLAARQARQAECHAELLRGFSHGWLPSRALIFRDPLLAAYHDVSWLQDFPFRLA